MGVVKLSTAGILDYSKTSNFLSGNAPVSFGAFDLLETTTLASSASSVTFSGLGDYSDYKHLQIRSVAVDTTTLSTVYLKLNADAGANYTRHYLFGNGTSVLAGQSNPQSGLPISGYANTTIASNITDILDFSNTSKNTTLRTFTGTTTSSQRTGLFSGAWLNTNAVTSIEVINNGSNFATGSRFSLYGIKG